MSSAVFTLYVPPLIAARLLRLRRSARDAITARLSEVLARAQLTGSTASSVPVDPPLRIYAEEYRVFYQVEPHTHRVVVLELRRTHL